MKFIFVLIRSMWLIIFSIALDKRERASGLLSTVSSSGHPSHWCAVYNILISHGQIGEATMARTLSSYKTEREEASKILTGPKGSANSGDRAEFLNSSDCIHSPVSDL